DHDPHREQFLSELVTSLEGAGPELTETESYLVGMVMKTLLETHPDDAATFDEETKIAREKLIRRLWNFVKDKVDNRPRTLKAWGEATLNLIRGIPGAAK